jgi:hypothetical protein
VFVYVIAEDRRVKRSVGMPACPQGWTSTLLRGNEQHYNLPTLGRPEASG